METKIEYDYADEQVCFEQSECWKIAAALKTIDAARCQLIRSQNALVRKLKGMTDNARHEFAYFYSRGGVTARDWESFVDNSRRFTREPVARDQLRLVVSNSGE
jgi:hypothetical protein